jgi:hypothetical protein
MQLQSSSTNILQCILFTLQQNQLECYSNTAYSTQYICLKLQQKLGIHFTAETCSFYYVPSQCCTHDLADPEILHSENLFSVSQECHPH